MLLLEMEENKTAITTAWWPRSTNPARATVIKQRELGRKTCMWPMVSKTSGSTQAWYCPKATAAVPELPEVLLREIMRPPMRTYDPNLIQEPAVLQVGFRSVFQILHLFFIFSFFFFFNVKVWESVRYWNLLHVYAYM